MDGTTTLDTLHTNMLCMHRTDDPGTATNHFHDGHELFVLLQGETDFFIDDMCYRLTAGDVLVIRAGESHRRGTLHRGPYERLVINLKEAFLSQLSTSRTDLSFVFHQPLRLLKVTKGDASRLKHSVDHCIQALASTRYGQDILATNHLKEVLVCINAFFYAQADTGCCGENCASLPRVVTDAIAYVEFNVTQNVTLTDFARYTHHNRSYISRCFKRAMGVSLQQYILGKKVDLAKKHLEEGSLPCDACVMSGFNDYSNFSRTFSKVVGCSPKQYRGEVQKG